MAVFHILYFLVDILYDMVYLIPSQEESRPQIHQSKNSLDILQIFKVNFFCIKFDVQNDIQEFENFIKMNLMLWILGLKIS